jgi:hypothetical protein
MQAENYILLLELGLTGPRAAPSRDLGLARAQTLCFTAYFQEAVHEKREEHYRVRECRIYFFPEDDTIEVIEPRKANSGIPQGTAPPPAAQISMPAVPDHLPNRNCA